MISYLKGTITDKSPTRILLDVNGVGFNILVTVHCSEHIGAKGNDIKILTYLHVREDILQLFGFISFEERDLFLHLISTAGIGPKKALAIMSGANVVDLQRYIIEEDLSALSMLPGIGKRTAQRLVVELKEKLMSTYTEQRPLTTEGIPEKRNLAEEAILALVSLGYNRNSAQASVQAIIKQNENINLEDLIKTALRKVS